MAMGFSGSKGGLSQMAVGFSGSKGGINKMAIGWSGSKGGIKQKEILSHSDYILAFKKLIENARTRSNKLLNESKIF